MKKITAFFLVFALFVMPARAENGELDRVISETAEFLTETVPDPQISAIGGEWAVIGLFRSGAGIDEGYFNRYYENAENTVRQADGVLSSRKYTEYSRVVLALSVIGKNPENVSGFDLTAPLFDFDAVTRQGINGSIWALIALGAAGKNEEIQKRYLKKILESELESGGWSMAGAETADADVTAMALTALSGHRSEDGVADAVERGIACLKNMQDADGGFSTYGTPTAESTAQVITAICSLGVDMEAFSKNGVTPADALMKYYKGGGFSHIAGGEINLMATEQALYALAAQKRQKNGQTPVFAADKADDYAIYELAKRGIMSGMGDGTFAPEKSVTRAEFTVIAVKTLGLSGDAVPSFSDVPETAWFYPYVSAAYKNGIVYGVSETEFNPNGIITREEAAAMLMRTAQKMGVNAEIDGNTEINGDVSAWAVTPYLFCEKLGILKNGDAPKKILNRVEIAEMVYNMLKKAETL